MFRKIEILKQEMEVHEADIFLFGTYNCYNGKVSNQCYKLEKLCDNDVVQKLDNIFVNSEWKIMNE